MAKLTLSIDNRSPQAWLLTGEELRIGADPACDIHIDNVYLQPEHARIRPVEGGYLLTAIRSGAPLQVNHIAVHRHVLCDGDVIQLGSCRLVFSDGAGDSPAVDQRAAQRAGCLRILGQGRTIRLDNPVTLFGQAGVMAAMISRRSDGYYLAHLEGEVFPLINRNTIGDHACRLQDGDRIGIGDLEFEFLQRTPQIATAAHPLPGALGDRQRHFTRVALQIPATIGSDTARWDTRLIDLSLSGALLEYPRGWPGDTGGRLMLRLSEPAPPPAGLPVEVRQIKQDRIGVAFVDLDQTGCEQVRRLVKASLGDPSMLHREVLEFN